MGVTRFSIFNVVFFYGQLSNLRVGQLLRLSMLSMPKGKAINMPKKIVEKWYIL
jgi:hypothetical protein